MLRNEEGEILMECESIWSLPTHLEAMPMEPVPIGEAKEFSFKAKKVYSLIQDRKTETR